MSYVKGNTILAADLNTFLGTVRSVYGVGTGDRGYGQTGVTQADVVAGNTINGSEFANLRTMVATCANHQGTAQTLLPTAGGFVAGQTIIAHETSAPSNNAYDLDTVVSAIDTNRLVAAGGSMSLVSNAHTITRATTWNTTITCTVDVVFASENAARYFFNSGGEIRLRMLHPNGTGSQNNDWRAIFGTKIGTVSLKSKTVTHSGSMSTANIGGSLGFHNLTTTPQNIVNAQNIGAGQYAVNDVTVTAAVRNKVGLNGGNGDTVRFVITFVDQYGGGGDLVAAGTNIALDHYRATAQLSGISAPTFTTITGF